MSARYERSGNRAATLARQILLRRRHAPDNRPGCRPGHELGEHRAGLAALGAGLILSGIVAILGTGSARQSATEGGTAGLIGLLITLLLAFLIGGYVAGRLASRSGLKHGLLVPLLALLVTILLAGIGALLGVSFIDQLSGVTLPSPYRRMPRRAWAPSLRSPVSSRCSFRSWVVP